MQQWKNGNCNFQTDSKAELKEQKHRASLSELVLGYYRQATVDRVRRQFLKAYCERGVPGNKLFIFFQSFHWIPLLNTAELPELLFGNTQLFVWKFEKQIKFINLAILSERVGAVFTVLDDLLILSISPYLLSDLDSPM